MQPRFAPFWFDLVRPPCLWRSTLLTLLAVLLAVVLRSAAGAEDGEWIPLDPSGAPMAPRYGHSAVYDLVNDAVIVFGGQVCAGDGCLLDDVWLLTNASGIGGAPAWAKLTPLEGGPGARAWHTAVYDGTTNRMVVFGGSGASAELSDVWVLSNASGAGGQPAWEQLTPSGEGPTARHGHTAVYDLATNRMVVFGGSDGAGGDLADLWILSNANGIGGVSAWEPLSPAGGGPTARSAHSAVYDPATNRMVVFGGRNGASGDLADLWVLSDANGTGGVPAWEQLSPASGVPSARSGHTAIYDEITGAMLVFGGVTSAGPASEAWRLADATGLGEALAWTQLVPPGPEPSPRHQHVAVYDRSTDRMLVFGGVTDAGGTADVWALGGALPVPGNTPPTVTITGPPPGTTVPEGATVTFTATASDDGGVNVVLLWFSDLDGQIGSGPVFSTSALSAGTHTVTLVAIDAFGAETVQTITVTVTPNAALPASGWLALTATAGAFHDLGANEWRRANPAGRVVYQSAVHPTDASQPDRCLYTVTRPEPVTRTYSGLVAGGGRVFNFGGGHTSHPGNDVDLYDPASNRWEEQYPPECPTNGSDEAQSIAGTGGSVPYPTPLGRPYIQETFRQCAWDSGRQQFVCVLTSGTWTYSMTTRTWTRLRFGTESPRWWTGLGGVVYDKAADRVLAFITGHIDPTQRGVYALHPATNQWSYRGPFPSLWADRTPIVAYNPDAGESLVHVLTYGLWRYRFATHTWTQVTGVPSSVQFAEQNFDYDTLNERFVFLIGPIYDVRPTAVWTWDPATGIWEKQPTPALEPPPYLYASGNERGHFVYEATANVFVYVESQTMYCALGGSWSCGGNTITWAYRLAGGAPPPAIAARRGHTVVYDEAKGRAIVFGGEACSSGCPSLGDVWVLAKATGATGQPTWGKLIPAGPGPSARAGHTAIYDPTTNRMTVFGGRNSGGYLGDAWVLTNANGTGGTPVWEQLSPSAAPPAGRSGHTAVYDPATNRMIVFGGETGGGLANDVWVLNEANGVAGPPVWEEILPAGGLPAPRSGHTAVHDPTTDRMVIFGGYELQDLWILANASGTGGPPTWMVPATTGDEPAWRAGHTSVYDDTTGSMLVFGGETSGGVSNEVLRLANATAMGATPAWTRLSLPVPLPAARSGHGAVFDRSTDRMLVFGGWDGSGPLLDLWVLTGALPVVVIKDLLIGGLEVSPASVPAGGYLRASYQVKNQGTATVTEPYAERVYLSSQSTLDATAVLLTQTQPWGTDLGPGATVSGTVGLLIPGHTAPGNYFLLVQADGSGLVAESDEANNVSAVPLSITPVVDCPATILIDNLAPEASSSSVSFTGTWTLSAVPGGPNGSSLESAGPGLDTYTWTTPVLSATYACTYQVSMIWTSAPSRGAAVPYTVSGQSGGPVTKTFDQRVDGGQFRLHGEYTFSVGAQGAVTVTDAGGEACADAVHFSLTGATLDGTEGTLASGTYQGSGAKGPPSPAGKKPKGVGRK